MFFCNKIQEGRIAIKFSNHRGSDEMMNGLILIVDNLITRQVSFNQVSSEKNPFIVLVACFRL